MSEIKKLFKYHFKRWVYLIEFFGWNLTVVYCDSSDSMPEEFRDSAAGTTSTFKYLRAVIYVNLRECSGMDSSKVEEVVVHELTHVLIAPLIASLESVEIVPLEYTVTTIGRVLQGLRNG